MAEVNPNALIDAGDVKEIIDTDLTDARVANFINAAYLMTVPLSGNLVACGGNAMLEIIQLFLAAHFLTVYERTVKSQSVGGEWSITFAMKDGEGLMSSLYGQNALALDCSGILAKAGSKRATFDVTSYYQLEGSTYLFDADLMGA